MGMRTPVTPGGLRKYDHLPPAEAAVRAWTTPGTHPEWDYRCKQETREALPLLARALDRLAREANRPGTGRHRIGGNRR